MPRPPIGRYEIREPLGKGGMGEVYRAFDPTLDREIALKLIPDELAAHPQVVARFKREAKALAALRHPGVVKVFSVEESEGKHFLTMELVDGTTLQDRIPAGGMELGRFSDLAVQLTDALAAVHELGIVHRDLKPNNILVDDSGMLTLVDFGLVKRLPLEQPSEQDATLSIGERTALGTVMGTLRYMSPEQARGGGVDTRSDIFSLGIVFYEMLTGRHPFDASSEAETVAAILQRTPDSVAAHKPEVSPELAALIERCLEKDPMSRFVSVRELLDALTDATPHGVSGADDGAQRGRPPLSPMWKAAAVVVLVLLGLGVWKWSERHSRESWARDEAIPEVLRLMGENRMSEAATLAIAAEAVLGEDPILEPLWSEITTPFRVTTDPPGAAILYRPYESDDNAWQALGQTPYDSSRFPVGAFRFRLQKEGFESTERVRSFVGQGHMAAIRNSGFDYMTDPSYVLDLVLAPVGTLAEGMVAVPGGLYGTIPVHGFGPLSPTLVPSFLIDRAEVTNAAYAEFVTANGYRDRSYWSEPFVRDGEVISWEAAVAGFQDSTGRQGPSTWVLGQPPHGEEAYPVGGVSWFESTAYCRWRGKELPTLFHWARAALPSSDIWLPFNPLLARTSNLAGKAPWPAASRNAIGISGAHDLAGNVREWASTAEGERRYLLGGAWSDPRYFVHEAHAAPPWQREATDGFRCAVYEEGQAPEHLRRAIELPDQDFSGQPQVDDAVFEAMQRVHSYDRSLPLAESVESSVELDWGATQRWVSIDSAYGERLPIRIHLPTGQEPPFTAIVYFGGGNVLRSNVMENLRSPLDSLVRSGRALVEPVYDGAFQRNDGRTLQRFTGEGSRELIAHWIQDLGRTIDYLEQHADFDGNAVSYLGQSTGAALAPSLLPYEPRIKAAILYSGGFSARETQQSLDNRIGLARRLQIPILMLGGKNDFNLPVKPLQEALFRAFGTPDEHKHFRVYDSGHWPLPMNEVIRETVDFLDRYVE